MPFDMDSRPPMPEPTKLESLLAIARRLGADEMDVLLLIASRLAHGERQYGVLNVLDGRDWVHEATEESADLAVYLCAALLRDRRLASGHRPPDSAA